MTATRTPKLRPIALPTEHGGWAFLYEPILLGLLLAPSVAGFLLGISGLFVFLLHQPLKIALKDRIKGRRFPRTAWAERFVLGYGAVALLAFTIVFLTQPQDFLLPLSLGVPFALVQVYFDSRNDSRHMLAEICGAIALATLAPAIAILAGRSWEFAFLLWLLMSLRAVTSILYVRARLRILRNAEPLLMLVHTSHAAALVIGIVLYLVAGLPLLAVIALGLLWLRAIFALNHKTWFVTAKQVGISEVIFGLIYIAILAVGFYTSALW